MSTVGACVGGTFVEVYVRVGVGVIGVLVRVDVLVLVGVLVKVLVGVNFLIGVLDLIGVNVMY